MGCSDGACDDDGRYFTAHDPVNGDSLHVARLGVNTPEPGVVKLTVPVGDRPETVALHVRVEPTLTGLGEQTNCVVEEIGVMASDLVPNELVLLASPPYVPAMFCDDAADDGV